MPGVVPDNILRPFRSNPAPDLQQFGQEVLSSQTACVLALILEERISQCLSLRKSFLGLGLSLWDLPSVATFRGWISPFFLFCALGFSRARAGLEPVLLDTMSCCSPAVTLGAVGGNDLPAASKPLLQGCGW